MRSPHTIFVSFLLPGRHPAVVAALRAAFPGRLRLIPATRDVWCRDFMPVPAGPGPFVQFRYAPAYLRGAPHLRTPDGFRLIGLAGVGRSPLVVDGGNVVRHGGTAVVTDRVYDDNPRLSGAAVRALLREDLAVDRLIVIPAEPGDVLGHADGVLRLLDERTAMVNDYRRVAPAYGRGVEGLLRRHGLDVVRCPYAPTDEVGPDGIPSAVGVYVNFLQTPEIVACPTYGLPADDNALRVIERYSPGGRVVPVRCDGPAAEGGALNCLTWDAEIHGCMERRPAGAVQSGSSMHFIVAHPPPVERGGRPRATG